MSNSFFEKTKEIVIYAPIGVACFIKDTAPHVLSVLVARGRSELVDEKVRAGKTKIEEVATSGDEIISRSTSIWENQIQPRIQRSLNDVTHDMSSGRDIIYSAIGALGFVKSGARGVTSIFQAKGKDEVSAAKEKVEGKMSSTIPIKKSSNSRKKSL